MIRAGRGRFFGVIAGLATALVSACRENLSPPPIIAGPDTSGPVVKVLPGRDTTVDSTGIMLVSVNASDRSGVKLLQFEILPARFVIPPQMPFDTTIGVFYSVQLGLYKHSTFRYFVRASDVLDHETVTDTVTVTVR